MAATALGEELGPPFKRGRGGPGGWILVFEPEVHLGSDVVVPDLAGWRRTRMPAVVADVPYFELAPDWLCEVMSPGSEKYDRADKLKIYAQAGVPWVWLINPLTHTLETLRLFQGSWTIHQVFRDDARVRAEPFDAIELDLSILWADVILPG
jgi:Uma2 family endonuclease